MALHGDIETFPLPDVLRLLATTGKSGRLDVTGADERGEVWFVDGGVIGGRVTTSPHAAAPADVVYELLRFRDGGFAFDATARTHGDEPRLAVDAVLEDAGQMLDRWNAAAAVVPSLDIWVSLVSEIDDQEVVISAQQWRTVAAVRGGMSVRLLGDRTGATDLAVCEAVKEVIELGLVELGDELPPLPAAVPTTREAPLGRDVEGPAGESEGERTARQRLDAMAASYLQAGAVVIADDDRTMLPEPLPMSGTDYGSSYEDSGSFGEVDGFEAASPHAAVGAIMTPLSATPDATPAPEMSTDDWSRTEDAVAADQPARDHADAPDGHGDVDDDQEPEPVGWSFDRRDKRPDAVQSALANLSPGAAAALSQAADSSGRGVRPEGGDEPDPVDRGSLLKFLSSVKS